MRLFNFTEAILNDDIPSFRTPRKTKKAILRRHRIGTKPTLNRINRVDRFINKIWRERKDASKNRD